MKNIKLLLLIAIVACMYSCGNEVGSKDVSVDTIWTNQLDTLKVFGEQHQIHSVVVGRWIRLSGKGFTGTSKVLFNGVSAPINSVYITENNITIQVPSTTPVPGDSTITVITTHGQFTYKPFVFK